MAEPPLTPRTKRRLFGIDRSGPSPAQTLSGQPLNPWTVPNAIGFVRLALIPVFLAVALSSEDGHDALAAALFALIGWGDYLDGFAARLTGQYSRLGALLDPVVDRLLVISGMAVAWHFELLPRWALAIVIAREAFMLVISRYGLARGVELKINWAGRLGVAPTMGAPFFAMAGLHWLALAMLYIGMALALLATARYIQSGLAQMRAAETGADLPSVTQPPALRPTVAPAPERKPADNPGAGELSSSD
ncbi:MAG: CDP-alcohol phosphatidyltransferase family protein [Solirubrobacteraceae bacterium]